MCNGLYLQGALGASESTMAMRATAAAERLRSALSDLSVRFTRALQPTAEALGQGLQLSNDAIQLFSEEVRSPLSFCCNFPKFLHLRIQIEMSCQWDLLPCRIDCAKYRSWIDVNILS